MESRVTKYSAAAVVALVLVLVLLNPFGGSKYGSVVLADVQKKVANIETMVLRGVKTFRHPGENGEIFEFDGIKCELDIVKYFSKQYGFVEEGYIEDNMIYRIIFNRPEQKTLLVFAPWKKYLLFTSTNKTTELLENMTPTGFINLLLESDYIELGPDNIDGVEVEGFEIQAIELIKEIFPPIIMDIQDYKLKAWIGVKEQLPIQLEGHLVLGKSFMTMFNDLNLNEVVVLDEYNVKLDESFFSLNPPEDYMALTIKDIFKIVPTEIKAGAAGAGLGIILVPAGFISWRRRNSNKK